MALFLSVLVSQTRTQLVPTPRAVPYIDHIAGVEAALQRAKLPPETSEVLRSKVCNLFQNIPKSEKNLPVSQPRAIRCLRKREEISYPKSGQATVVMNRDDYHQNCLTLLQPPMYMCMYHYQGIQPTRWKGRVAEVLKDMKLKEFIHKALTL